MKYKTNWNRSFLMRISQLIKFNEYKKVIESDITIKYGKLGLTEKKKK